MSAGTASRAAGPISASACAASRRSSKSLLFSAATQSMFSRILWWKTVTLQTAYVASMLTLVAAAILLFATRI